MAKHEIRAMLPGMFYRKPSPDEPNYKEVGETVAAGDVIGLIEVMKSYHQVTSDAAGIIISIIDNEETIVPGQVLVELDT